jgi:hypothetical protein
MQLGAGLRTNLIYPPKPCVVAGIAVFIAWISQTDD